MPVCVHVVCAVEDDDEDDPYKRKDDDQDDIDDADEVRHTIDREAITVIEIYESAFLVSGVIRVSWRGT